MKRSKREVISTAHYSAENVVVPVSALEIASLMETCTILESVRKSCDFRGQMAIPPHNEPWSVWGDDNRQFEHQT